MAFPNKIIYNDAQVAAVDTLISDMDTKLDAAIEAIINHASMDNDDKVFVITHLNNNRTHLDNLDRHLHQVIRPKAEEPPE